MTDELYAALIAERYGPIPWHECFEPARPRRWIAAADTPRKIAKRRRELCAALDPDWPRHPVFESAAHGGAP